MALTTVYLCNNHVHVAVGTPGAKQITLRQVLELQLEEGCLINGVITNDTALGAQLSTFWRANDLPIKDVALVIDSTQFLSKMVQVPAMAPKKQMEVAKNELAPMETRQDPVVDYMVLRTDKKTKTDTLLASSVERSFLQQYVAIFEKIGISLCSIDTALACYLKLMDFMPVFQEKTCILLIFDGDNLQAILLENGHYKYSSRSRLFNQHGTPEFGTEVTSQLSSTIQFQLSDKSGYTITDVFFCGCDEFDFTVCMDGCRTLRLEANMLPDDGNIILPNTNVRLGDCVYVAGNYISR